MRMVPRITITSGMLVSINVTDSADWDPSATYGAGDLVTYVTSAGDHLEYQSQQAGNLGNNPETDDGTWWLTTGYTNSWRMIDGMLANQTENATSIEAVMDIGELFTSVVCYNVSGASVRLEITEGSDILYDETIDLVQTDDCQNCWDYFFTEPSYKTVAIFPSVPGFSSARVTLTVSAPSATAKIGEAIFGRGIEIGITAQGSGPRLKDYSIKDENIFGEFSITERTYARGAVYEVAIDPQDADFLTRKLAENRAKICAFFPDADMEQYGLTVIGFYTDFSPGLPHRGKTIVTIPITGIT